MTSYFQRPRPRGHEVAAPPPASDKDADVQESLMLVPMLHSVLDKWMVPVDQQTETMAISAFTAVRAPSISLFNYLQRIATYCLCSKTCFELSMIYIKRVLMNNPELLVSPLNAHRLVITSIVIAVKYLDDKYFSNRFYALVGGIPLNEMNALEVEFLKLLNFDLYVAQEEFRYYEREFRLCLFVSRTSRLMEEQQQAAAAQESNANARASPYTASDDFPQDGRAPSEPKDMAMYDKPSLIPENGFVDEEEEGIPSPPNANPAQVAGLYHNPNQQCDDSSSECYPQTGGQYHRTSYQTRQQYHPDAFVR